MLSDSCVFSRTISVSKALAHNETNMFSCLGEFVSQGLWNRSSSAKIIFPTYSPLEIELEVFMYPRNCVKESELWPWSVYNILVEICREICVWAAMLANTLLFKWIFTERRDIQYDSHNNTDVITWRRFSTEAGVCQIIVTLLIHFYESKCDKIIIKPTFTLTRLNLRL